MKQNPIYLRVKSIKCREINQELQKLRVNVTIGDSFRNHVVIEKDSMPGMTCEFGEDDSNWKACVTSSSGEIRRGWVAASVMDGYTSLGHKALSVTNVVKQSQANGNQTLFNIPLSTTNCAVSGSIDITFILEENIIVPAQNGSLQHQMGSGIADNNQQTILPSNNSEPFLLKDDMVNTNQRENTSSEKYISEDYQKDEIIRKLHNQILSIKNEYDEEISKKNRKIQTLENNCKQDEMEVTLKTNHIHNLELTIQQLQHQLDLFQKEYDLMKDQYDSIGATARVIEELLQENSSKDSRIESLKDTIQQLEIQIQDIRNVSPKDILELQKEMKLLDEENSKISLEFERLKHENKDLKSQLLTASSLLEKEKTLRKDREDLQLPTPQYLSHIESVQLENRELQQKYANIQYNMETLGIYFLRQLSSEENKYKELQLQLHFKNVEIKKLEHDIEGMRQAHVKECHKYEVRATQVEVSHQHEVQRLKEQLSAEQFRTIESNLKLRMHLESSKAVEQEKEYFKAKAEEIQARLEAFTEMTMRNPLTALTLSAPSSQDPSQPHLDLSFSNQAVFGMNTVLPSAKITENPPLVLDITKAKSIEIAQKIEELQDTIKLLTKQLQHKTTQLEAARSFNENLKNELKKCFNTLNDRNLQFKEIEKNLRKFASNRPEWLPPAWVSNVLEQIEVSTVRLCENCAQAMMTGVATSMPIESETNVDKLHEFAMGGGGTSGKQSHHFESDDDISGDFCSKCKVKLASPLDTLTRIQDISAIPSYSPDRTVSPKYSRDRNFSGTPQTTKQSAVDWFSTKFPSKKPSADVTSSTENELDQQQDTNLASKRKPRPKSATYLGRNQPSDRTTQRNNSSPQSRPSSASLNGRNTTKRNIWEMRKKKAATVTPADTPDRNPVNDETFATPEVIQGAHRKRLYNAKGGGTFGPFYGFSTGPRFSNNTYMAWAMDKTT